MKLHKSTYQILFGMMILAAIDILTHQLWIALFYMAGWGLLLFRRSNSIMRSSGMTSPVTGSISSITKSRIDGEEIICLCIDTMPVIDPQNFRGLNDKVVNVKVEDETTTLEYSSGIKVSHTPYLGLGNFHINQGNLNAFFSTSDSHDYGFSVFGCKTNVLLPGSMYTNLIQGQKVIDGETVIGRSR